MKELQEELLQKANRKENYNEIAEEIYKLREDRHSALVEQAERKGSKQKLEEMEGFLNNQTTMIEEFDERLVRMLIDRLVIFDDKIRVEFKSGAEIDIEQ
jgi:site-specific DNA recombinase